MKNWIIASAAALAVGTSGIGHAGSYTNDFSTDVGFAQLRGNAVLDSGSVRLTENLGTQEGSLVIGVLDAGTVQSFDASFSIAIGPSGIPPADGISFSFGPAPATTYGESGAPTGLVVSFDTFDNIESPTPPVIRIVVNGAQVTAQQVALESGGAFRTVTVHWDANGLDVNYNGGAITFTDVALPGFIAVPNYQFTFGGRTGGATSEQRVDNVTITTTAGLAAPGETIPTLGEWAMLFMASLLAFFGAYRLRRRRPA